MHTKFDFKVGDIVLCSERKGEYIFRIESLEMKTFTQHDVTYGVCTQADVVTDYAYRIRIKSIYQFALRPDGKKTRRSGFNTSPYYLQKADPNKIQESIRELDKFLTETFP